MSPDPQSASVTPEKRNHVFRRLYEWTISWADRPSGTWALFFVALAESSLFPVLPDFLLLALCVGASATAFRFSLICSAGAIVGGIIGYWGYELIGESVVHAFRREAIMA